jgi:uncharacterized membrane protein
MRLDALFKVGRPLFAFAIIAIGVETLACARVVSYALGPRYEIIPIIPFLPAIPWLAYVFGSIWVACGTGLLFNRTMRTASLTLGGLLFVFALAFDAPRYAGRTVVFEPLALASLAWLLPGPDAAPNLLYRWSRYLLALSLIVFGVDHFLALAFVAALIPGWIPLHLFWAAFFGAAFVASGLSIGFGYLQRWGAGGIGLMFAIWVVTLHVPRTLGFYAVPGAIRDPAEWSSLFIAIAMWGGSWALARASK